MEFCLRILFANGGEKMTIEEKNRDTGRSGVPPDIRFHRVYRRDRLNGFHLDFWTSIINCEPTERLRFCSFTTKIRPDTVIEHLFDFKSVYL